MSDIFKLRSFVGNQVERLASPTNLLVDKFRQTVDGVKQSFSSSNSTERDTSVFLPAHNIIPRLLASESLFLSTMSPRLTHQSSSSVTRSTSSNTPNPLSNMKLLNERFSRRQSTLRRHVSESNKPDDARPVYHTNPPVDVQTLFDQNHEHVKLMLDRSRSLIRQSTDTTCTYPIRRPIRRMESIEIPGLNGVKSLRYINDDLGRLEPELYKRQVLQNEQLINSGRITFTLFYNQLLSTLTITIVSIDHLPYRNMRSKIAPNPFLKINLLPDRRRKFQTKVYKHTQAIQLNETFQFQLPYDQLSKRSLLLSVYDFCRSSKRNSIGTVKIDDMDTMPNITAHDVTWTKNLVPGTEVSPL